MSENGVASCAYSNGHYIGAFMNWVYYHNPSIHEEWHDNVACASLSNVLKAFNDPDDSFILPIQSAENIPFASEDCYATHPFKDWELRILNHQFGLEHGTDYIIFEDSYYYSFNAIREAFQLITRLTTPQYQNILEEIIDIYYDRKKNHAIKRAEYLKEIETQTKAAQNVQEEESISSDQEVESISSDQEVIIPKTKGMLVIRTSGRAKFIISTDIQSKLLSLDELTDAMEEITLECLDDEVMPSKADVIMIENISKNNIAAAIIMYK